MSSANSYYGAVPQPKFDLETGDIHDRKDSVKPHKDKDEVDPLTNDKIPKKLTCCQQFLVIVFVSVVFVVVLSIYRMIINRDVFSKSGVEKTDTVTSWTKEDQITHYEDAMRNGFTMDCGRKISIDYDQWQNYQRKGKSYRKWGKVTDTDMTKKIQSINNGLPLWFVGKNQWKFLVSFRDGDGKFTGKLNTVNERGEISAERKWVFVDYTHGDINAFDKYDSSKPEEAGIFDEFWLFTTGVTRIDKSKKGWMKDNIRKPDPSWNRGSNSFNELPTL